MISWLLKKFMKIDFGRLDMGRWMYFRKRKYTLRYHLNSGKVIENQGYVNQELSLKWGMETKYLWMQHGIGQFNPWVSEHVYKELVLERKTGKPVIDGDVIYSSDKIDSIEFIWGDIFDYEERYWA